MAGTETKAPKAASAISSIGKVTAPPTEPAKVVPPSPPVNVDPPEVVKAEPPRAELPPPPPPAMPKRPARVARSVLSQATPAPQPEQALARPVLSKDPAERAKQLEGVRGEAATITNLIEIVVSRLTPAMPLTGEEKSALQDPLEQVLFKYDGAIPCEWQLAFTIGFITLPRYPAWKATRAAGAVKDLK